MRGEMKALRFLNAVLEDVAGVDEAAVLDGAAGVDQAAVLDGVTVLGSVLPGRRADV